MRRVLIALLVAAHCLAGASARLAAEELERGRLRILRNGQTIGSERYEITGTATEIQARGEIELHENNVTLRQTSSLLLTPDYRPRSYEWKMEEPEKTWRVVKFSGNQGTIRYPLAEGQEDEQVYDFGTPQVAVLGLYHHFLLLARLYDFSRGGPQTIRVFVPHSVQPGEAKVELQEVESQTVEGGPEAVRRLAITTQDAQVQLWLTESGRFVRLRAPVENVEVVRESPAP